MNIPGKLRSKWSGIKREYIQKRHFFYGPIAFVYAISPYLGSLNKYKHRAILRELRKIIPNTSQKFADCCTEGEKPISKDCPIWVMWWQGCNNMPPLVKACYASMLRNRGCHPVVFLDRNNYCEYVQLPPPIVKKCLKNGWISTLSDMIRFGLLSKHGGIWLDSTIYVASEIGCFNQSLYSIRHKKGNPRWVLDGYRWSSFMFASSPNHPVTSFIFDGLIEYFTKEDFQIDYFMTDYILSIGYLNNTSIRKCIDELPLDNPECLKLLLLRDTPYNAEILKSIFHENRFNKLDWRIAPKEDSLLAHIML